MSDQLHAYDTRPEAQAHNSGDSPEVWRTPQPMHIHPLLWVFGLLVLLPACIYFGLLVLTMTGLVTL